MAEFALVVPLFFFIIMTLLLFGAWAFDQQALQQAARMGVRDGNEQLTTLNVRFGKTAILGVPYTGDLSIYASGNAFLFNVATTDSGVLLTVAQRRCLENRQINNLTVSSRLGWDWGCVYTPAILAVPLDTAIDATLFQFDQAFIGRQTQVQVSACYIVINSLGNPVCAYERTSINRGPKTNNLGPPPGNTTIGAPSFIQVRIWVDLLALPVTNAAVILYAAALTPIDRFLPACPAPATYTLLGNGNYQIPVGSCGALY